MNVNVNLDIQPLINKVEKFIINSLNKKPYKSYANISDNELNYIYNKTIKKFPEIKDILSKDIIVSIKASFMKNHMINNHKNLIINSKKIIENYSNKLGILKISEKYDISPLNILRLVFKEKYNSKITNLIANKYKLSEYDNNQLILAINNDIYALIDNSEIQIESLKFEKDIQKILDNLNVTYKTQEELVKEQIQSHGKPFNTPDFLIISKFKINNNIINWIDAKNFYGSNIKFINKKIKEQTEKYIHEYGPGCIVFKLGFNENLKYDKILLVNYNSFLDK
jgi:hypothetical protein